MTERLKDVERPHDPRGTQEIWRRAEKKYKNYDIDLIPTEERLHSRRYMGNLIRREALQIAVTFLKEEGRELTLENLHEKLGYANTPDNPSVYILLQENIDLVKHLGIEVRPHAEVYREHEDAAQRILARGGILTARLIAEEYGSSPSNVSRYWQKHKTLREKFPL